MLYIIDNKYYIKVGRKYIKVDTKIVNKSLDLKPDNSDFIEENDNLNIETISFNDLEKKLSTQKDFDNDTIEEKRTRYSR